MIEVEIDKDVYLPCFQHLLEENDIDIELIWGGRDSGKSKFVAQLLTEEAMSLEYFRCLLIKETHESIKDAQWQMIRDTVDQWDIDPLFRFISSPLTIQCLSGASFHARGTDKPGKLRSFSNPSHAWLEEGNQLSEEAFVTILTGLRSDYGRVKFYVTFNPEADTPDYTDFWLYKWFFKGHEGSLNFTGVIKRTVFINGKEETIELKYRSTHVTYHDNRYVTPQRIAFHESLAESNPYWYRVFTMGLWGNVENDSPWAYAFNRQRHVSNGTTIPHPVLDRSHEVYLCWDFNRNPMTCVAIQHYEGRVRVLEVIRIPKSGVDEMCRHILMKYPGCLYLVTGDYNGNNENTLSQQQVTHYKLIKRFLGLTDAQIKVKPNPRQALNSTHINNILAYYPVTIHGTAATALIFDLENVKRRADGTIAKTDRDDPAQQADALDCFRYFCNAFLNWFVPDQQTQLLEDIDRFSRVLGALADDTQEVIAPTQSKGDNAVELAVNAIYAGKAVSCTKEEYHDAVRGAILEQAGRWIDNDDSVRAKIALSEVKRLDQLFA